MAAGSTGKRNFLWPSSPLGVVKNAVFFLGTDSTVIIGESEAMKMPKRTPRRKTTTTNIFLWR